MPSTPTTNSNFASPSASSSSATPSAGTGGKSKPRAGKKTAAKVGADEGSLVDQSLQKTTRKTGIKPAAKKPASSFEKPAEADWHRLISETAYYRAESRGFHPGYEHEDWAWAEEEVRKQLTRD